MNHAPLDGLQRAATVLLQMGPERAARVLKGMSEAEVMAIAGAITALPALDAVTVAEVVGQFVTEAAARYGVVQGGTNAAKSLLEIRLGQRAANDAMAIFEAHGPQPVDPLDFLSEMSAAQLLGFLKDEHPQTVALVLNHLPPDVAAAVLAGLSDELRVEAARRVALMGRVSPDFLERAAEVLKRKLEGVVVDTSSVEGGGVASLVEILNRADRGTEKSILAELDQRNPELAEQIRNQLFVFDDVVSLDDRTLQKVLRHVVPGELAVGLKSAEEEVRTKFLRNLSERAAADVLEEMEVLGPVRLSQVESAQAAIVRVVRELDAKGEIILVRGDDEMVA
ncbi:MAG: flagellar motor switch protein FliG [Actinomycetota bacterium]|nr:flagellar motor switch protein FliG [Actinomycetota bacterium]